MSAASSMSDACPHQPPTGARQLLLASASPRRRELLTRMGLRFRVQPVEVTEWENSPGGPAVLVEHNAALKARTAAARLRQQHGDVLVLGADTTVSLDASILNKPPDIPAARAMLRRLAGRTHTVYTALCLIDHTREHRCTASSQVTFKPLDEPAIDAYLAAVNPLDKAGAYGIQHARDLIIAHLDGSVSNVMGLPTESLQSLLRETGLWEQLT